MNKLSTVSLFSGCGGSDIGAKKSGAEVIFANDNNLNAIATYNKYKHFFSSHSPEVVSGDVKNIKAFPPCDLLIGCYPCQCFTMGGHRSPEKDLRSKLFLEFRRCVIKSNPKYFVTENVPGLAWLEKGKYLSQQIESFLNAGKRYRISIEIINSKNYGVPQERKRLIIVGVRKDLHSYFWFPEPSHGPAGSGLPLWASHGDAIENMPINPEGEYYDYPSEPFSWWYLSRNRKKRWEEPSYSIQANWRHVPLHPASPTMKLVESNLKDKSKQRWEFTGTYDHLENHPDRPKLKLPRRLSWRECAAIQTFPPEFEPVGSISQKFEQIGNATPPRLMQVLVKGLVTEKALKEMPYNIKSTSLANIKNQLR